MINKNFLSHQKLFDIFLHVEKVLNQNSFPVMTQFAFEEMDAWLEIAKKFVNKDEKIIEIGCGNGRNIKKLIAADFFAHGLDNNHLFVDYCRKQNLNVFYLDATKPIPKKYKSKYMMAGIALNTLFNFPKEIRKKWLSSARDLLKEKGVLVASVYSDTKFLKSIVSQKIKYYEEVFKLPEVHHIEFLTKNEKKGFCLHDNRHRELWFSECLQKNKLLKEVHSWKGFQILSIKPMKCKIGWILLLSKR